MPIVADQVCVAAVPACSAGPTRPGSAGTTWAGIPASPATANQEAAVSAISAGIAVAAEATAAGRARRAGPAGAAEKDGSSAARAGPGITTVSVQQPGVAAVATGTAVATAGRAGRPVAAPTAVADQPRRPAGAAGGSGAGAVSAVAAGAVQESTGPTGLAHPINGSPIGAVADQRAPQQRLGRCVDGVEQLLLHGLQGYALAASAPAYQLPPAVRACTN